MADFKISKKDLLGALGYVSTQSGPVTPARDKIIKTMKSTLKPVKDQTSQYWDTRKYDNDSLASKKNYLNLRDIGIKIMTEATTSTSYSPMRLNLSGMDMSSSNLNGKFKCDGHDVTVNLKYPNANNNISVELALENGVTDLYEVPIESDQFQGNFANAIRLSARDLIKKSETPADYDEMFMGDGAISGVGNNFNDVLGTAEMIPSTMVATESVDWRLQKLLNICLEAGEDFTEDDFAIDGGADAGMGGDGGMDMGMDSDPGMGDAAPQDAGDVNGNSGGNGDGDDNMEFREFMNPSDPDHGSGLTQAGWDNMAEIVADALENLNSKQYSGVKPDTDEWYEGFPGTKFSSPDDLLDQFLSFTEYKALDTSLPVDGLKQFAHALEGKLNITKFKTNLGKWFPEVYNTDGTAMHDVAEDVAGMSLPGDDSTGMGGGLDMNSPVDLGGDFGGGFGGGGDFGGDFGGFNDTEGMMDMADDMAAGGDMGGEDLGGDLGGEDFGGDDLGGDFGAGIDTTEGADDNGMDDTDIAVNSLDVG